MNRLVYFKFLEDSPLDFIEITSDSKEKAYYCYKENLADLPIPYDLKGHFLYFLLSNKQDKYEIYIGISSIKTSEIMFIFLKNKLLSGQI